MIKRRCNDEAEKSSFIRIECVCSSVNSIEDYQHVITSKKSSGHLLSVSASKVHLDIYLHFSLNDRFLVISLVTSR